MKSKLLAVGLVIVLVVAAAFVLLPGGSEEASMLQSVTVHVADADGSEQSQATVNTAQITNAEQFLMSFGQGIRPVPLQADGGDGGTVVYKTAPYTLWATAVLHVTGSGIKSIKSTSVTFSGITGPGTGTPAAWSQTNHAGEHQGTTTNPTGYGLPANPIKLSNLATLNGDTSYDQATTTYKFTSSAFTVGGLAGTWYCPLYGDLLNGAKVTVSCKVVALDMGGFEKTAYANATISLTVSGIDSTLTATVISANSNIAQFAQMIEMPMVMAVRT